MHWLVSRRFLTTSTAMFVEACSLLLFIALATASLHIITAANAESAPPPPPRTAAQLEQLVAPIALYPDALLSQVLMASTYPLEVIEAARWSQANPGISGQALEDAMQKQQWDPSIKALTAVPQALQMMSDKLDWTKDLGDAFLAQQKDVLDAVQRLRGRADAAGNLQTTAEQKVAKVANPGGAQAISAGAPASVYTIEPTNPDQYYVPIYDPGVVYGAWPYPGYAPFYWYPPGYVGRGVLAFGAGVLAGAAIWGGIDWWRRRVDINVNRYNRFNRTNIVDRNWTHNPAHRGAVPYRDANVAQRFGRPGQNAAREAYRPKAETGQRELKAGQGAGGLGPKGPGGPNIAPGERKGGGAGAAVADRKAGGAGAAAGDRRAGPKPHPTPAVRTDQSVRRNQGTGERHTAQRTAPRPAPKAHAARPAPRAHAAPKAGGGRGGGGGGRRSDIRLKSDITLLGRLANGIGFYRFRYNDGDRYYVGVMAQEVQTVMPEAVAQGRDGYLRVVYEKLGVRFQTYERWITSGAELPAMTRIVH
jgi:Protein of unknown function (DUF3300)/Chaperone of endosialidase